MFYREMSYNLPVYLIKLLFHKKLTFNICLCMIFIVFWILIMIFYLILITCGKIQSDWLNKCRT